MLQRPNGAAIAEIMRVTKWQPHTIRGFISRALVHDLRLKVTRFKRDQGQAAYRLPRLLGAVSPFGTGVALYRCDWTDTPSRMRGRRRCLRQAILDRDARIWLPMSLRIQPRR